MPISSVLLVITRGDSIGGAQVHVQDLARALAARGMRVAVAAGTTGPLQEELDRLGIRHFAVPGLVRSINPLSDLVAIRSLRKLIREFKPGLVHCHTAKAGLAGRVAAFLSGVPSVYTVHGWQFAEGQPPWQKLVVLAVERLLARATRRIITVSQYDRDLALRYRLASPEKIALVHNGVPWLAAPARREPREPVRLVMVARFQEQKDHACLFSALELLESLPWELELVGDGPNEQRWKGWAARRGWQARVCFRGQVGNVPERLESCDLLVLASRWEGLPLSILEAMRAALPVVASDVGGCREVVEDGTTGFIVPPRSPQAMAEKLKTLIMDPDARRRMGTAGRLRYEQEFTFDRMVDKTISALNWPN